MSLLIFFALPLATILLAIVFQKILKSPILVAITFFAIYLVIAFILSLIGIVELGPALVAVIIYTIIAFITAYIVMLICKILKKLKRLCRREDEDAESDVGSENENNNNNKCCCHCHHNQNNDVAVQGVIEVQNNNDNNNNNDNDNNNNCSNKQVAINASVSPNFANGGRTGTFRGCYRRR